MVGSGNSFDDNDNYDDDDVPLVTKVIGKSVLQNKSLIVLVSEKNERSLQLNSWPQLFKRLIVLSTG